MNKLMNKLSLRLVIPIALVIFTLIVSYGSLRINSSRVLKHIDKTVMDDLNITMTRLQGVLEFSFKIQNPGLVQDQIAELGTISDLNALILIDNENNIIASTNIALIGTTAQHAIKNLNDTTFDEYQQKSENTKLTYASGFLFNEKENTLTGLFPINLKGNTNYQHQDLGILFVQKNLGPMKARAILNVKKQVFQFGIILLGFALLLAIFLHFKVTKRIQAIIDSMNKIAKKKKTARLKLLGNDEIAELAETFAFMESYREKAFQALLSAKEQAEAANKAKTTFLGNINHELRTPLNSIIGFAELLKDSKYHYESQEQKKFLEIILKNSKHLLELIGNVLDLSRIETGKCNFSLTEFDIAIFLKEECQFALMFKNKNQNFVTEIKAKNIIADKFYLRQILYNLCSNAHKFTPFGGTIGIKAEQECDDIIITVWDTGIGILEQDQAKIFEKFYQVETDYNRNYQGTGLGLALVKQMIELHGGQIQVKSEYGKGSVFTFNVPQKHCNITETVFTITNHDLNQHARPPQTPLAQSHPIEGANAPMIHPGI